MREVKNLFSLIPIWITFFGCSLVGATGNTFFFEQTSNLNFVIGNNVHIPLKSLFALRSSIRFIISFFFWSKKATQQHVTRMRIGVGMICSILCCIAAWQVEVHRLYLIKEKITCPSNSTQITCPSNSTQITDPCNSTQIISMSILWLVPQFSLLGLMDGLASDGLQEFFYDHVATSMRSYGPSFSDCVLGFGNFISMPFVLLCRSWFKDCINTSHLDRYYLTLAILSFVCLVMYAYASYPLKPLHMGKASEDEELSEILVHGTQPTRSVSFPMNPSPLRASLSIRRRNGANAAAATATESQPTKSASFPFRSNSLRLKDKKVGESAANVDSPEHMKEPLLQSHALTEAEEGLPPDDKPGSHHD